MRSRQLVVFFVLLGVALAADTVGLTLNKNYRMGATNDFSTGRVLYVNTDDTQTKFVASSQNTLRFYPEDAAGDYDNTTAYNVVFNETIPQMRYRGDGTWLAVRGATSNLVYFMKQNTSLATQYYVDHSVDVGSRPLSIAWAYNDDTLAAGLADGKLVVLERDPATNKFFVNQTITTGHGGGVAKVFGKTSRIYTAGAANDTTAQVWRQNITTKVWVFDRNVTGVGKTTDSVSAMHVSGNEKRWGIARDSGDIYIMGHGDSALDWTLSPSGIITGAHTGNINFLRFTGNGWHLLSGGVDGSAKLWSRGNNWATPGAANTYFINPQSVDWDGLNKQFTVGQFGDTSGAFMTEKLGVDSCSVGVKSADGTYCVCPAEQSWFIGGAT